MDRIQKTGIIIVTLLVSACSMSGKDAPVRLVYSPNGEPLNGGALGRLSCPEAVGHWFDRVAQGHAYLTLDAVKADAEAQFDRMDLNRDGLLYSEELERYRAPYRVGLDAVKPFQDDPRTESRRARREKKIETPRSSADPDPVLSADRNADLKVTRDEYRDEAARNFAALSGETDGKMVKKRVLESLCD